MTIAIDISQIVHEGTGVANYTKSLVEAVLKADTENTYILFGVSLRKKQILDLFIQRMKKISARVVGKTYPLPERIVNTLWNTFHLWSVDDWIGTVDVFHSSDWIQPPTSAKKVTTIHDVITLKFPETSHPYIVATQKKRFHWVQKECDHVFADSIATKDDILKMLSIQQEKISVVYPGIDPIFFHPDDSRWVVVQKTYALPEKYILAVGTQEPRKNLHRLLAAYERMGAGGRSQTDLPELIIVGKYGWGEAVKEIPGVKMTGYVPAEDLPLLYRHATVFVFPSVYEGFGLPILEAMACGCPVVTSDRGSLKEIAGDNALVVNPEDISSLQAGIEKMTWDTAAQQEYRKRGQQQAQQFHWKETAEKVVEVYKNIHMSSRA